MSFFSISIPFNNMKYKIKHIPSNQFYYSSKKLTIQPLLLFVDFEYACKFSSYEEAYHRLKKLLGISQIYISSNYRMSHNTQIIDVKFDEFEIIDERWD